MAQKEKKNKSFYTMPIYFQPENVRYLCEAVLKAVYYLRLVDTDVHRESINISTKYLLHLNKFFECHQVLNRKFEFDDGSV